MKQSINLSNSAILAIINLQHPNGTYRYYNNMLSRMINLVLNQSDEIGMSDREAMATLRAIHSLREDLADIAGSAAMPEPVEIEADEYPEDVATKVEAIFSVIDESDDNKSSDNEPE